MLVNLRPCALRNTPTVKLNKSMSGSGPEALPPNVLSRAPAGRTLRISHFGTLPAYSIAISSRYALAHPILLSATTIVVSVSNIPSFTTGRFAIKLRSTLKPTPVPHIRTYISSSNARG